MVGDVGKVLARAGTNGAGARARVVPAAVGSAERVSAVCRAERCAGPSLSHSPFVYLVVILVVLGAVSLVPPAAAAESSVSPSPAGADTTAAGPAPATAGSATGTSASPGAQLYASTCAGCHGPQGEGGAGPTLAAAAFPDIVAEMVRVGGGGMPAFASPLKAAEIDAIADYVASELADPAARQGEVAEGGEIYRLYCAGCHGSTGRGGALTGATNAPSLEGMPAAHALAAMIAGPGNMPTFVDTLDTRQQAAVSLYVQVLVSPPAPGGEALGFVGPVAEGFVALAALVVLVLLGVWLAWGRKEVVDE